MNNKDINFTNLREALVHQLESLHARLIHNTDFNRALNFQ